jgi:hypothetical protein
MHTTMVRSVPGAVATRQEVHQARLSQDCAANFGAAHGGVAKTEAIIKTSIRPVSFIVMLMDCRV